MTDWRRKLRAVAGTACNAGSPWYKTPNAGRVLAGAADVLSALVRYESRDRRDADLVRRAFEAGVAELGIRLRSVGVVVGARDLDPDAFELSFSGTMWKTDPGRPKSGRSPPRHCRPRRRQGD